MVTLPLKFKAGRVNYNEQTNVYTPSPIKGEITIKPSDEAEGEGFYNFTWAPRESVNTASSTPGVTEADSEPEELLVIAGDVTWKRVKSCKTGRVYMLTFISSGAKNLFWLQEPNGEDEEDNNGAGLSKESARDKEIFDEITKLFAEPEGDDGDY
ncbi:unnamed protein product [Ambrosiozyma monospora]|uniref:Unnamed protein product n=1 Tax=Ambrosiozyma monospora TaxID=43982 RepID=A0ACB5SUL1_AMBMO|nr:unnamed protein product [Ambrosiozyma monospora]